MNEMIQFNLLHQIKSLIQENYLNCREKK